MNDLTRMREKLVEAMQRDVSHIFTASSSRKLNPNESKCLVDYLKALNELGKLEEKESIELSKLTEDELKAKAQELLK